MTSKKSTEEKRIYIEELQSIFPNTSLANARDVINRIDAATTRDHLKGQALYVINKLLRDNGIIDSKDKLLNNLTIEQKTQYLDFCELVNTLYPNLYPANEKIVQELKNQKFPQDKKHQELLNDVANVMDKIEQNKEIMDFYGKELKDKITDIKKESKIENLDKKLSNLHEWLEKQSKNETLNKPFMSHLSGLIVAVCKLVKSYILQDSKEQIKQKTIIKQKSILIRGSKKLKSQIKKSMSHVKGLRERTQQSPDQEKSMNII